MNKIESRCLASPRRAPLRLALIFALALAGTTTKLAAAPTLPPASLSQLPQFLQFSPKPNVFITVDNSGSMERESLPDSLPPETRVMFPYPTGLYCESCTLSGGTRTAMSFAHTLAVAQARSSAVNLIYYNPAIRYMPWVTFTATGAKDTTTYANATATAAYFHPYHPGRGTLNLTAEAGTDVGPYALYYRYTGTRDSNGMPDVDERDILANYTRVEIRSDVLTYTFPAPNQRNETGCSTSGTTTTCSYAAELQNFANWFQYYRSRTLLARGAIGNAIAEFGSNFRVGLGLLNGSTTENATYDVGGYVSTTVRKPVRDFAGAVPRDVFDLLHNHQVNGITPSARALWQVGKYFEWRDADDNPSPNGPWVTTPGATPPEILSCRQSFHVYSSDGYWNQSNRTSFFDALTEDPAARSADSNSAPLPICPPGITPPNPKCYLYDPGNPTGSFTEALSNTNNRRYISSEEDTLADIAMYFWYRDLQPGMDNNLPPTPSNPAFWQHVSTIGVAMGLVGQKTSLGESFLTALDGDSDDWPTGFQANGIDIATADDLWHAAINSRGRLLIANDPQQLSARLSAAMQEILKRSSNGSAAASSSAFLENGTSVFTAEFTQGSWSGDLYRREIDPTTLDFKRTQADGTTLRPVDANGAPYVWRASDLILSHDLRNHIFTMTTSGSVVPFDAASLDSTQMGLLDAAPLGSATDVINYVRGDRSKENSASPPGNLRDRPGPPDRNNVLGTIANSSPLFVKDEDFSLDFLPKSTATINTGQESYLKFLRRNQGSGTNPGRTPLIWVGSNGGMFHAFDARDLPNGGTEVFAYVPRSIIRNLPALVDPKYQHRYFVDGVPAAGDAYFGSSCNPAAAVDPCWRTVVVSSLGAGGRAVFAIDATDPSSLGASSVLWEIDDAGLAAHAEAGGRLGHVMGPAFIARVKDSGAANGGRWVAIFGNGPESELQQAALFVVDLATGAVVRVLPVGAANSGNGLSAPVPLFDSQRQVIAVYAGDLRGNLWKFDLSGAAPSTWTVAYTSSPLVTAQHHTGSRQPVVAKPLLRRHPKGGVMVVFGTGSLMAPGDRESEAVQTLYGVWDKPGAGAASLNNLVRQAIVEKSGTPAIYKLTNNPVNYEEPSTTRGWLLDLGVRYNDASVIDLSTAVNVTPRERMVSSPQMLGQNLLAQSFIPSIDSCVPGGQSMLFRLDFMSGSFQGSGSFTELRSAAIEVPGGFGLIGLLDRPGSNGADRTDRTGVAISIGTDDRTSGRRMDLLGRGAYRTWRQILQ